MFKQTMMIRLFGLMKIPLIFYVRPSVIELSEKRVEIKIPLNRRTKNHLNGMYFGTQAIGADLASGALAMELIEQSKTRISLIFKDFKADFLKRAEGDVHFICEDGAKIKEMIDVAKQSDERVSFPLHVRATVPKLSGDEPVSEFVLTMSLKRKT